jgi:hypothetical protein
VPSWPGGVTGRARERAAQRHCAALAANDAHTAERRGGEWWVSPLARMPEGETVAEFLAAVTGRAPARLCGLPVGPNLHTLWAEWGDAKRGRVLTHFQLVRRREEHAAAHRELRAAEREARFNADAREFAASVGLGGVRDLARAADNFRRAILSDRDPDLRGRPRGGGFAPPPELARLVADIALDPNRIGVAEAVRLARHEAKRLALPNPSAATWRRWFTTAYPPAVQEWHRGGPRRGEAACIPKVRRDLPAAEPFETVELDGQKIDIMHRVADIRQGWRRRRQAVLVFAVDLRTAAVAWDLRAGECAEGVAACLYQLLTRYGRPRTLRTDNGRAIDKAAGDRIKKVTYDNEEIGGICAQLGIRREGPPPHRPWSKGCAERFARVVKDEFGRWFPAFWGGSPAERPEARDRQTRGDVMALPTIDELRAAFEEWVENTYMRKPRETPGLGGLSPALALEQLRARIERVPEQAAFYACALREKEPRRYARDGVHVDGWLYRVRDVAEHVRLAMTSVYVRRPPNTADFVLLCDAAGAVVAHAHRVQLASVSASREDLREIAREQARARRELRGYYSAARFSLASRAQQLAALRAAEAQGREAEVRAQLPAAASPAVTLVAIDVAAKAGALRRTGTYGAAHALADDARDRRMVDELLATPTERQEVPSGPTQDELLHTLGAWLNNELAGDAADEDPAGACGALMESPPADSEEPAGPGENENE